MAATRIQDYSPQMSTKMRAASTVPRKCKETWEKLKAHFANGPPVVCNEQQQATVSVVVLDVDLISLVWCFFMFFLQALFLVELNCDASSDYQYNMQP